MSAIITYPLNVMHDLTSSTLTLAKDTLITVGGAAVGSVGLGRVLESGLIRVMQKQIKYNRLTLILPSGKTYTFGPAPISTTTSTHTRTRTRTRRITHQLVGTGKYDYPHSTTGTMTGTTMSERSLDSSFVLDRSGTGVGNGVGVGGLGIDSGVSTPPTSVGGEVSPRPDRLKGIYGESGLRMHEDEDEDEEEDDEDDESTPVTIKIKSTNFFLRLLLSGDLGFAEAYMAGECEVVYTPGVGDVGFGVASEGDERERARGQRLDGGYYGEVSKGLRGEKEGEELLELFKIAIRSDHPSASSSRSYHLAHPTSASTSQSITGGLNSLPATLFSTLGNWTTSSRVVNSVRNSVGNIKAHYDISNRMFASFLSADMTYSCAIFPELDGDLAVVASSSGSSMSTSSAASSPDDSFNPIYLADPHPSPASHETTDALESAQYAKLHHIIRKAKIRRGHRVLEIGSGWGSMAIEAVRLTGCTVDTLTLSTQQKVLAEERIIKAGLQDSITVHLMDFRSIPDAWKHTFDRLVSVEMLEAVGKEYIQPYFKMIDEVLNEKGVAVFQVITIPESRFDNYSNNVDFIQKWSALLPASDGLPQCDLSTLTIPLLGIVVVFPGGFLPSVTYCTEMISKGSQNRLTVDSMVNIGPHYARTLREWRLRFLKNFDRDIRPALRDEHPEMTEADVEVFKRKWIYYFVYCEIGFAERLIGDHIISISREGNRTFGSDVYA